MHGRAEGRKKVGQILRPHARLTEDASERALCDGSSELKGNRECGDRSIGLLAAYLLRASVLSGGLESRLLKR